MTPSRRPHPEERLLRLIRSGSNGPKPPPAEPERKRGPGRLPAILAILALPALGWMLAPPLLQKPPSSAAPPAGRTSVEPEPAPVPRGIESAAEIPPPPGIALLGIIDGGSPSAVIEDREQGRSMTLEPGDTWKTYRVERIRKGRVTFTNDRETFMLRL